MKGFITFTFFVFLLGGLSYSAFNNSSSKFEEYKLIIPKGFPEMKSTEGNELTASRVLLGRKLFYDPIMSIDSSVSCASCHHQALAFADNMPITPGVERRFGMRNAPSLANVGYNPTLLFDGFLKTLEMQVLVPIQEHAEMANNIVTIARRLCEDSIYNELSYQAYDKRPDPFVITRSISAFERTLISGNSKYDQEVYQNKFVLNKSERNGMNLFFNELHCAECHNGFNFTNFTTQNNGLYKVYADSGRQRVTGIIEDQALFKVPTLRNIELTAPYMHDGSILTLEGVIKHYESGGNDHANKNEVIKPFKLSPKQRKDLINFLKCLTDWEFVKNPNYSNPFN